MKAIKFLINGSEKQSNFQIQDDKKQEVRIRNLDNIKKIGIYYVDAEKQMEENIGNIHWPEELAGGNIKVFYNPETESGEIQIEETDYIWNFDTKEEDKAQKRKRDFIQKEEVLKELDKEEKVVFYAEDLIEELKQDIFGQDEAIKIISEIIASEMNRKSPGLISILVMGPTGVGKTQLAKNLAPVMTKVTRKKWGLQNFSMNQFKEAHSVSRMIGTSAGYVGFGGKALYDASRGGKPQVYLFDEFDKTHPDVVDSNMEVFSEGKVQLGDNTEIDLRGNTIILMTTNLPINMEEYNRATPFMKKEMCRDIMANHFGRPEIAGKITHALAFQELSDETRLEIIEKFVEEILGNYDIEVEYIDRALAAELLKMMKVTKYGARGIKDALSTALNHYTAYRGKMEHLAGKRVGMYGNPEHIRLEPCA